MSDKYKLEYLEYENSLPDGYSDYNKIPYTDWLEQQLAERDKKLEAILKRLEVSK